MPTDGNVWKRRKKIVQIKNIIQKQRLTDPRFSEQLDTIAPPTKLSLARRARMFEHVERLLEFREDPVDYQFLGEAEEAAEEPAEELEEEVVYYSLLLKKI